MADRYEVLVSFLSLDEVRAPKGAHVELPEWEIERLLGLGAVKLVEEPKPAPPKRRAPKKSDDDN